MAAVVALGLSGLTVSPARAQSWGDVSTRTASSAAVADALRAQVESGGVAADVAAFYRDRDYRPLWAPGRLRLDVDRLAEALNVDATAARDDPWRLAQIELEISTAYAERAQRAATGGSEELAYIDPLVKVKTQADGRAALEAAADAPTVADVVAGTASGAARNQIYEDMARGLERYRLQWSGLPAIRIAAGAEVGLGDEGPRVEQLRMRLGLPETGERYDLTLEAAVSAFQLAHGLTPTGRADGATIRALNAGPAHYERLIEANMARAQALPPMGDRFILVDAAAGELWFYDQGQAQVTMKVVTGKPSQPTPMMVGMARHLIFNPYWNVPEDLVQTSIAPKVLAQGLGYIESEGLEVLSDYSDEATVLDPAQVDWRAVQAGKVSVRVRQRPGPKNMMGKVKLMLPNPLGIYLHDTPHKGDFAKSQRLASSGCVRLEDAMHLARVLVGEETADAASAEGGEERRVDLGEPVPVFITYFTAMPTADGFEFRPDAYGRDTAWEAQHAQTGATSPGGR
ncbi:L,D-transpeptidase family protein [Phenylobacterium sp. VNQ135]|uniref:L,D-transpeptidase family protein n=1 Tax=Phenylobacterium sp. VNQ135 TaxID=3400922 RepID=UPI003C0B431D